MRTLAILAAVTALTVSAAPALAQGDIVRTNGAWEVRARGGECRLASEDALGDPYLSITFAADGSVSFGYASMSRLADGQPVAVIAGGAPLETQPVRVRQWRSQFIALASFRSPPAEVWRRLSNSEGALVVAPEWRDRLFNLRQFTGPVREAMAACMQAWLAAHPR